VPGSEDDELSLGLTAITNLIPSSNAITVGLGRLELFVISKGTMTTHALPDSGRVELGRSSACDITVYDESMSRQHAVLTIGDVVMIEDVGSVNGTTVRGQKLVPNQPQPIVIGELVALGAASILLQQRTRTLHPRTIWTRPQFHARLEEECAREERSKTPFVLVRFDFGARVPPAYIEETLADLVRDADIIGKQSDRCYQVLLLDTAPAQAEEALRRIDGALRTRKLKCQLASACCPRDGRSASELDAKARGVSVETATTPEIVVVDARMKDLYRLVEQIAISDISVLLLGETGVGKEVLARSVHRASGRAAGPFIELNCAALTEALLESELFGHEKGAFTNAIAAKPGLLEAADGGTLFLDEIGDMPLTTQVKLLRAIEDSQLRRVGGLKSRTINVRFVAATNSDIDALVARGSFRSDLYFRLNAFTILVPPLRERPTEIEPLARAFIRRASQRGGLRPVLTPDAIDALRVYAWPGNVRELKNAVERAALLCAGGAITPEHFSLKAPAGKPTREVPLLARPRKGSVEEQRAIIEALEKANGNQTRAAQLLGISRRTLVNRLSEYRRS
jgi:two-component system, NtrC family, response regulator AtoC